MQVSKTPNIVSVSWGDHLIFGEGDGRLETLDALHRRMQNWKTELGAGILHWRCTRNRRVVMAKQDMFVGCYVVHAIGTFFRRDWLIGP